MATLHSIFICSSQHLDMFHLSIAMEILRGFVDMSLMRKAKVDLIV